MGSRRTSSKSPSELTARQRFWLKHIRAAERGGEALKHYATRQGLSEHSLYEAKRRLRARGVLAPASPRRKPAQRFTRVVVSEAPAGTPSASPLRVRLASGVLLEWPEAPQGERLRELVELLTR